MYRQFEVHPEDTKLQGIVWTESPLEPIKTFELTTITYGTASAPFQAIRCLQQIANDEKDFFKLASIVIKRVFMLTI